MTAPREWEPLERQWQAARTSSAELDEMIERAVQARRAAVVMRMLATTIAVVGLAIVAAALRHAGNILETSLGLAVAIGISGVWLMDAINQRDSSGKVEAPAEEYREARRSLCMRQIRFARFAWIVVALDLAFLVPWWIGGIAVHGAGFHPAQIATIWTPLALMAGVVSWTVVVRKRALRELERLAPPAE